MSNRIRATSVEIRRLSPAEAEVWIQAELDRTTPTTELRGRLVGPRCPGVSTVEVAYPLRPPPGPTASTENTITLRAAIPEPNLWTEKMPFVYEGTLELWQDGRRCDSARVSVALKL
jgi:hypothetical protein